MFRTVERYEALVVNIYPYDTFLLRSRVPILKTNKLREKIITLCHVLEHKIEKLSPFLATTLNTTNHLT